MPLDIAQLPGLSPLARAYATEFVRLAPYYAWDPHAPGSLAAQAACCEARTYPRDDVCAALAAQYAAWGGPSATAPHARLADPRALAVLTGQQTGLFGGPLFTLYKALTVLALAARLERELDRPVIPIFWLAAEDHDVAEADHVHLPDRSGAPLLLRHDRWAEPGGYMPAQLRLGPAIHETLARAWEFLPESEFSAPLREALAAAYAPEHTLSEAFARWMLHLLGETGLVLADGADPRLKRLATPIFQQELAQAPAASLDILEVSRALRDQGFSAQIEARPDGVNCFLLRGGRRALTRDAEGFRLRDSDERIAPAVLQELAVSAPETFSPNVALRPIVQDTLFPTLAYVAGPGELAYFAQLRPVYRRFGVPMPVILPRATFSLLEPRIAQLLDRFHFTLPDLATDPEQLASRVLRAQLPADFEAALGRARHGVEAIFREIGPAIAAVDPTLSATAGQTAGHVQGHLDQLERKAVQALKRREAETRQQIQRVREALMPGGHPQERVFPALPYLWKYGPGLLDRLREEITGPDFSHRVLPLRPLPRSTP